MLNLPDFSKLISFSGRGSRIEFLLFGVAPIPIIIILFTLGRPLLDQLFIFIIPILMIWKIFLISIHVRRLHDINLSGYWVLVMIPLIPFSTLFLCAMKGTEIGNKYDESSQSELASRKFQSAKPNLRTLIATFSVVSLTLALIYMGIEAGHQQSASTIAKAKATLANANKARNEESLADSYRKNLTTEELNLYLNGDPKTGEYGYIDNNGKLVSDHLQGSGLSSLAAFQMDEKWGFIDKAGRVVIHPQYDRTLGFSEDLAAYQVGDYIVGSWGFIDRNGNVAIEPKYSDASSFSEGLAAVRVGDIYSGKYGFINKSEEMKIGPQFENAGSFSGGLAAVMTGERKWGFIDKTGNFVIRPQYNWAFNFSEGLAKVATTGVLFGGPYGYIDRKGILVINTQFKNAGDFSSGLAAVEVGGKWGYINNTGAFVIKPEYDSAGDFSSGLAAVRLGREDDGDWRFIDKLGRLVINPKFKYVRGYS
jgi:uncharacterized membrane protein YhaH (DUF805 family)